MSTDAPVLDIPEGGWKTCRACPKRIVFAKAYATGKLGPYELDDAGEWEIREGLAHHVGKPAMQPDLFKTTKPHVQRWTSHFVTCPAADQFRRK